MRNIVKKMTSLLAMCTLLIGLYVPNAYAAARNVDQESPSTLVIGESSDKGPERTLYPTKLTGEVGSTTEGTSASVTGYIVTKGIIDCIRRSPTAAGAVVNSSSAVTAAAV